MASKKTSKRAVEKVKKYVFWRLEDEHSSSIDEVFHVECLKCDLPEKIEEFFDARTIKYSDSTFCVFELAEVDGKSLFKFEKKVTLY